LNDPSSEATKFQNASAKYLDVKWGNMDLYTAFETRTPGTERMFTALTEVLRGEGL
jgi:hypothetical protein